MFFLWKLKAERQKNVESRQRVQKNKSWLFSFFQKLQNKKFIFYFFFGNIFLFTKPMDGKYSKKI